MENRTGFVRGVKMRITPKQRNKLTDEQCPDADRGWNSRKPEEIMEMEMQDERLERNRNIRR